MILLAINNIQIIAGFELTVLVNTIREILRKENNIGEKSIITNGYVLNSAVRYLNDTKQLDFRNTSYWEKISQLDLEKLLDNSQDENETMKFRLSTLSNDRLLEVMEIMSETFGSRIRKNYVVKLFLKSYLYEKYQQEN